MGASNALCAVLTERMIGTAVITITLGVQQESLTSCLYITFVNDLKKIIKEGCVDRFLAWIHMLVLMDDTVLLSKSRGCMIKKIKLIKKYCKEFGMKINQ